MSFPGERGKGLPEDMVSLLGVLASQPDRSYPPTGEDFQQLANELESDPPSHLSPEGLELVLAILRGEELPSDEERDLVNRRDR